MISIFCLGTCDVELGIKSQIFFFYFQKRNYFIFFDWNVPQQLSKNFLQVSTYYI